MKVRPLRRQELVPIFGVFRAIAPIATVVYLAIAVTACNTTAIRGFRKSSTKAATAEPSVAVRRGNLAGNLRISGTVGAVQSHSIVAPRLSGQMTANMVATGLVRSGTQVREGDILVEFDRQAQLKNILDKQAEYDSLEQQIRKKQADHASAQASDETELKAAEVDVQTARVEMRKNDVVPGYQAEINKVNLAEAEARWKQLQDTFALKREARAAELRILEIQRDRSRLAVEYAQANMEKMTVRSPLDGLVVLAPINKGGRRVDPQEGDEFRPGAGILMVVDPSRMQVSARVNQVDISQVYVGQRAGIRLDAYPDLVFKGKVERVSIIGISSTYSKRIRYFSILVSIQGSHPRLLPDLTASVDLLLESAGDALIVPREAIILRNGQAAVEVLENGRGKLQAVKTGLMNDTDIVVESGLKEGTLVALTPKL